VEDELDIARLYDQVVAVGQAPPAIVDAALFPEESAYLAIAVPKPRAEFGTARICARKALTQLGVAAWPLVPGPHRAPTSPPGVVGSISHAHEITTGARRPNWAAKKLQTRPQPTAAVSKSGLMPATGSRKSQSVGSTDAP
jgi:4'-phosphopantetheinyl transferase EntD